MKKNKKLFAILTLVAFMMTLVPALAFAANETVTASVTEQNDTTATVVVTASSDSTLTAEEVTFTLGSDTKVVTADATKTSVSATFIVTKTDAEQTIAKANIKAQGASAYPETTATADLKIAANPVLATQAAWTAYKADTDNDTLFQAFKNAQKESALTGNDADKAAVVAGCANVGIADAYFDADSAYTILKTDVNKANLDAFKLAYASVTPAKLAQFTGVEENTLVKINGTSNLEEVAELIATGTTSGNTGGTSSTDAVDPATSGFGFKYNGLNKNTATKIDLAVMFNDAARHTTSEKANLVIWAEEDGTAGTPTTGFTVYNNGVKASDATANVNNKLTNAFYITDVTNDSTLQAEFARSGKYTVYAAIVNGTVNGDTAAEAVKNMTKITNGNKSITINGATANPKDDYRATVKAGGKTYSYLKDGQVAETVSVTPNNVAETYVQVTLNSIDKDGNMSRLVGKTVNISTNSANLSADKETATTDYAGAIDFNLSGSREGIYYVYVNCEGFEIQLKVNVGNTAATYITTASQPDAPVALFGGAADMDIRVDLTDVNGNVVSSSSETTAPEGAKNAFDASKKYVSFVTKPTGTILTNDDLSLRYDKDDDNYYVYMNGKTFDKEGSYEIKVVLDNGNFVSVPFEVKRFETPVSIQLDYEQTTIELAGKSNVPKVKYVDANGTKQDAAKKVTLAGTGYAISNFATNGQITVKNDEKYVGQTITVTAVDSRYNLTASTTLLVAEEAQGIAFDTTKAQVNVNNKIGFKVVDSNGNTVSLGTNATVDDVQFVIIEKPEDAKVSAVLSGGSSDLKSKGTATMALTSNKEGDVKVQVLVKATVPASNTSNTTGLVTKYYTGTETFKVTKEIGKGSAVVMTIGSATMVVNDTTVAIDAPAMIKDNRTFVPVRALMEAFGATVDFDATTNVVTIKADGKTITLTLGSSVLTVGDQAVTMDVAAFATNEGRTMVPVRAIAEAAGYTVEATYNADGSTASVVFTK